MNAHPQDAGRLLQSELWKQVMNTARQRLKDQWALEVDREARELLWHRYQGLIETEVQLKRLRDDGVMGQNKGG